MHDHDEELKQLLQKVLKKEALISGRITKRW